MRVYWIHVFPHARRELLRLERRAQAIPDPLVRLLAIGKLRSQRLVTEGAAAFATLAPARHRRDVMRVCITYEVLYDYLDALGEQDAPDPLTRNRRLHRALSAALAPDLPLEDYDDAAYKDGGYLWDLIAVCRAAMVRLPTHREVLPALQRFAARASEAQSLNHAGMRDGHDGLAQWAIATQHAAGTPIPWWEFAAAAGDPLGLYALVALAGHRGPNAVRAAAVEQAYFPWVGALVWLLESLVDQQEDAQTGNHSYVGHYPSPEAAACRLAALAQRAAAAVRGLPDGDRHIVLLAGVVGMYLSHEGAATPEALGAAGAVRAAIGGPIGPLLAVLRLRRRIAGGRGSRLRGRADADG